MLFPARHCFCFPAFPRRLGFPTRGLNCQLSNFNSPVTAHRSLFSLLYFQHFTNPPAPKPSTDRFLTPSVSVASELLFRQILCFQNDLRCPLVFPSIDFRPPLHRAPLNVFTNLQIPSHSPKVSIVSRLRSYTSSRLALADTNGATYNLPPSISGAHYGR